MAFSGIAKGDTAVGTLPSVGLVVDNLVIFAAGTDDVDDQERQADQTDNDACHGEPHRSGDQPDDEQHEPHKGGRKRQTQHVICLMTPPKADQLCE